MLRVDLIGREVSPMTQWRLNGLTRALCSRYRVIVKAEARCHICMKGLSLSLGFIIIGVQILDVLVHAISEMLEPIRIVSNLCILFGFASIYFQQDTPNNTPKISTGIYVLLNLIFVFFSGLVNPATDKLRIPLFFFVGVTFVLAWLFIRSSTPNPNPSE